MNKENIDVIEQKLKYATGKNHNKLRLDKITEKFDNPALIYIISRTGIGIRTFAEYYISKGKLLDFSL